jgi:hypothetical protein
LPLSFEKILIYINNLKSPLHLDPDSITNHQLSQSGSIDEHHPRGNTSGVLLGASAEPARGDKDTLVGLLSLESTNKGLDLGSPDRSV